jgi:hypothetical protein
MGADHSLPKGDIEANAIRVVALYNIFRAEEQEAKDTEAPNTEKMLRKSSFMTSTNRSIIIR